MPELTPDAWAQIRHDYENTDRPLAHICAEHEVSIPTVRYRMKKWNWQRRRPAVPDVGPAAAAPLPACGERSATGAERGWPGEGAPPAPDDNESPPHPTSSFHSEVDLSPHAGRGEESIVPRLQRAVARVLPAIDATIARLGSGSQHPREMEQAGRALSSLTRTLRELKALLAQHKAAADDANETVPEQDIDAFRYELARRLQGIIAVRKQQIEEEAKAAET